MCCSLLTYYYKSRTFSAIPKFELLADINLIILNKIPAFHLVAFQYVKYCVEVCWTGYALFGVTEIAILENLIGYVYLVSIIHINTCNIFIAILKF